MLELLACSRVRRAVIAALLTGSKNIADLSETSGSSRPNTIHLIEPLLKARMVARDGNRYALTPIGRANAVVLQEAIDGIEVLQSDFWKTHDLGSIPDHLMARIGALARGQVICPNGDLLKAQHNFVDVVSSAKEIYGVSSVFFLDWPAMILAAYAAGATIHLILAPEIQAKLPETLSVLGQVSPQMEIIYKPCQAAFTVADNVLSIGLFALGGGYDPLQDFICEGPKAATWGRELYDYYLNY